MNKKLLLPISLISCILAVVVSLSGCASSKTVVFCNDKSKSFEPDFEYIYDSTDIDKAYLPYLQAVTQEAVGILMSQSEDLTEEVAIKMISTGYEIETYLDTDIVDTIAYEHRNSGISEDSLGCALTDMDGCVVALYSNENDDNTNFALTRQYPYSSIKPLSVYSQAIENGVINFSSVYKDSPYKQLTDDNGELYDWPMNASGDYQNKDVSISYALAKSLNTTAVKVLDDVGVTNSLLFLAENLNMPLQFEIEKASFEGEQEVIGNLAMGYTYAGVAPLEMAGYYRMFADGGNYSTPKTIKSITDSKGKVIYEHTDDEKQVLSDETAFIMNRLLHNTVKPGGTGYEAALAQTEVCGKTGTGDMDNGHWFVGVVPQYSCAVWHDSQTVENYSPRIFKNIMSSLELDESADYPYCENVTQRLYCAESGLLAKGGCSQVEIGYYCADDELKSCTKHK